MAAAIDLPADVAPDHVLAPYRAISRSAVISVVLAVVSLPLVALAIFSMRYRVGDSVPLGIAGAAFALIAGILGGTALLTIRRFPLEYTGCGLARFGLVGGVLLFALGSTVSAYTYVTEVPEGYVRVGFWELQPDPDRPELPVGPKALDVAGQKIFIKGYMHPGVASRGKVNHFILVPDMGTCCFGGQPKMTDMIEVVSPDSEGVAYSTRRIKLAGTFQLMTQPTQSLGLSGVVFHLQADRID
jgi:Protein of unknown function (DUF3299)